MGRSCVEQVHCESCDALVCLNSATRIKYFVLCIRHLKYWPYRAGDSGDIAGLKCHDLTSNESW